MTDVDDLLCEMRAAIAETRRLCGACGPETKRLSVDMDAPSSLGTFEGYAAIYGTEDRNGEIIDAGAMTQSIEAAGGELPLLLQHNREDPIGVVRLVEDRRGVKVFGQLHMASEAGQSAYALMIPPEGFGRAALRDLSIGYVVRDEKLVGGVRHLKRIDLFEVSLVTIAAHPNTFVTSVKSAGDSLDGVDVTALEALASEMRSETASWPARSLALRMKAASMISWDDFERLIDL